MTRVDARSAGKRYAQYPQSWRQLVGRLRQGRRPDLDAGWALRDVTFAVGEGESAGIIGMNGAGKSTLLRILTGTTRPTEGSVSVTGTVAAVLELGIGMHPDLSGWQNAALACQLMGLEGALIRNRMGWIQEFSELGDFMDQPLRTYSSGMQLRLAFSAATAVRPDVLIVDEVLAVGDAYFGHKCMRRIRSFQKQGTTLILVTHDLAALKALCRRALLLDQGRLLRDGPAEAVLDYYYALIAAKTQAFEITEVESEPGRTVTRSGTREAEILSVELTDAAGTARSAFRTGETAHLSLQIRVHRPMPAPTVGFVLRDRFGADVFGTNTARLALDRPHCRAEQVLRATFEVDLNLGYGNYSVAVALHRGEDHLDASFDWWDQALVFEVIPDGRPAFVGVAALPARATILVEPSAGAPAKTAHG
jgi:lipopolysaccharide transport system ATP-binding protein